MRVVRGSQAGVAVSRVLVREFALDVMMVNPGFPLPGESSECECAATAC